MLEGIGELDERGEKLKKVRARWLHFAEAGRGLPQHLIPSTFVGFFCILLLYGLVY